MNRRLIAAIKAAENQQAYWADRVKETERDARYWRAQLAVAETELQSRTRALALETHAALNAEAREALQRALGAADALRGLMDGLEAEND